ncbi:MAG: hypothetical protein EPN30_07190 [Actinomycetota bacterium]|nr:MAG: hypothetical protein EPN30_07190 [Actinomycetota bacterium]
MTFAQLVDLVVTVVLLVLLVMAGLLISEARSMVRSLEKVSQELEAEMKKLVHEVSGLVDDAEHDVSKFETLLDSATTVTNSFGGASRIAYSAVVAPLVKAKALRAGAAKLIMVFKSQPGEGKGGR